MSEKKEISPEREGSDAKQDDALQLVTERRKILRTILTGGGVGVTASVFPATWTKPVVDSITLPAHAQTSVVTSSLSGAFSGAGLVTDAVVDRTESELQYVVNNIRDMLIPLANAAGPDPVGSCVSIVVEDLNDPESMASVKITFPDTVISQGSGTLEQLKESGIECNLCSVVTALSLTPGGGGEATIDGTTFTLTAGACTPDIEFSQSF